MERKKIIQIVVVVACFAGSGVVLYNGFFSKPKINTVPVMVPGAGIPGSPGGAPAAAGPQASSGTSGGAPSAVSNGSSALLPYGGQKFDFSNFEKRKLQFDLVNFPTINTSTDVGVDVPAMIK